jgi:CRP-like cAMP-binding protein/predicted GNAT family N-acyltransferase
VLELSEPGSDALIDSRSLQPFCRPIRFAPGEVLRRQGQHYRDMYVLTDGAVDVDRAVRGATTRVTRSGDGCPIGEIGFLRGCVATATVTAQTAIEALVIDDPTFGRLEREQPAVAAALLRRLAEIAEDRTSDNVTFVSGAFADARTQVIDVYLCRNEDMLRSAQRLRYDVYCQELRRNSPYADHDRKIISDDLDRFGHTFIAMEGGETIGTLRTNLSFEGSLGLLDELYGMRQSPHHPKATSVCTKFIIRKSKRGSPAAFKLISAVVRLGRRDNIMECYIDCVPALMPFYQALGFTVNGPMFFHRENGPSLPMVLDLVKHGKRLGGAD